ncbi:MAG: spore photoproduct lyase [Clostridiales bacterium]|nr:spore photoproduct lyase [Clostridiales bacterium]
MKEFIPEKILYDPAVLSFPLGKKLMETYLAKQIPMEQTHAYAPANTSKQDNAGYKEKKRSLSLRVRHIHFMRPDQKAGIFHVSYTSSGCPALCLYCPLLRNGCHSPFLQLYVNREEMLEKLLTRAAVLPTQTIFDIGRDSDLIIENTITGNLAWTIRQFCAQPKGRLCFSTRFCQIEPLLSLPHQGRVIPQMNINPDEIIWRTEFGTSHLAERIQAVNRLCEADYPTSLCIAPVLLIDGWQLLYEHFLDQLADLLSRKAKKNALITVSFLSYSLMQKQLITAAFSGAAHFFDHSQMTGQGFYQYPKERRRQAEAFFRDKLARYFPGNKIIIIQ